MATNDDIVKAPPNPGDIVAAQKRRAAPRNLDVPAVQPSATGQSMTPVAPTPQAPAANVAALTGPAPAAPAAAPPALTQPSTNAATARLTGAPQQTFYGAPGQPPGTATPDAVAQVDPRAAAARNAEFTRAALDAQRRAAGAAPPPAAAAPATPAPAAPAEPLSRLARAKTVLGRAASVAAAIPEGAAALNNFANGNIAEGVKATGLAAMDAAAPYTLGTSALLGHGIDAGARALGPDAIGGTVNQIATHPADTINRFAGPLSVLTGGAIAPIPAGAAQAMNRAAGAGNDDAKLATDARARLMGASGDYPGTPAAAAASAGGHGPPPTGLTPDKPGTTVDFIDPTNKASMANRPRAPEDQTPEEAMNSTAPGTAVVNGKVIPAAKIRELANRNVVSGENMRNPALGTAYSALTGGKTLTDAQGVDLAGASSGGRGGGGSQFVDPGYSGGIGGPATADQQQQKIVSKIMDLATTGGRGASGGRRSARTLIELLGQLTGAKRTEYEHDVATRPKPQSEAEQNLLGAQAGELEQRGAFYQGEANKRENVAALQDQLMQATDPAERQILANKLAAASGKVAPDARQEPYHNVTLPIGDPTSGTHATIPVRQGDLPDIYKYLMGYGKKPGKGDNAATP